MSTSIGVHMFAVTSEQTSLAGSNSALITTLCDGHGVYQFGPTYTTEDRRRMHQLLVDERPKTACDILWFALELKRILGTTSTISPLEIVHEPKFNKRILEAHKCNPPRSATWFKIWRTYPDDRRIRAFSAYIARRSISVPPVIRGRLYS